MSLATTTRQPFTPTFISRIPNHRKFTTTLAHIPEPSPLVARLMRRYHRTERHGLTAEEWNKGTYAWMLEQRLEGLKWGERLPLMQALRWKVGDQIFRCSAQQRREVCNAEYIVSIKQRLLWRRQVLSARIQEQVAYEEGLRALPHSRAGKTFSAVWDAWAAMKRRVAQWDPKRFGYSKPKDEGSTDKRRKGDEEQ